MAKTIVAGVLVVIVLGGIIVMRLVTSQRGRRGLSSPLVKLYGLLSVAGFALMLAWSDADSAVKAGGYTLFGTIAGFLAGANIQSDELHLTPPSALGICYCVDQAWVHRS